jgi:hypothetical protein
METARFANVTIYTKGGFGNIVRSDVKEVSVETVKYAQYKNALKVMWKAPRQRTARSMVLTVILSPEGALAVREFLIDAEAGRGWESEAWDDFQARCPHAVYEYRGMGEFCTACDLESPHTASTYDLNEFGRA